MAEICIENLKFNDEESANLLRRVTGMALSDSAVSMMAEQMDGWAAGLYVAGLTLRRKPDLLNMKPGMVNAASEAMAYLFEDVLLQQPPQVQEFLLRTSILDELNHSLCEAVAGSGCAVHGGQHCLDFLVQRNLFLNAVNEKEGVYRYHHLFQSLLSTELKRRHDEAECEAVNKRASEWYASKGQPEEALRYALRMREPAQAVQVVSRFRHKVMNDDDWQQLEHWLSQLPREVINASADLVVAEAYITHVRFRLIECADRLDVAERLLAEMLPSPEKDALMGEVFALRSWLCYVNARDPVKVTEYAQLALKLTPHDRWQARITGWLFSGIDRIFSGKGEEALVSMDMAFADRDTHQPGYKMRLLLVKCFVLDHIGRLSSQQRYALEGLRISASSDVSLPAKMGVHFYWLRHQLASVCYQRNELAEAEAQLKLIVEHRYQSHVNCLTQSLFVLALIHQAQGRPAEAMKCAERAERHALEMRSTTLLPLIKMFEIQLALQQGRTAEAVQLLGSTGLPEILPYSSWTYTPYATIAKVHLAAGAPANLDQAEAVLARLHEHARAVKNQHMLIEMLALKALLADARQDQRAAITHLEQALLLGQPEGFVRVFADHGPRMHDLLSRFHSRHVSPKYVRRVASAVSRGSVAEGYPSQAGLLEPLTNREMEVLALLMKRMSNKEIADALFISPGTVKHHTHVIFEKLEVHSRREAVMKALDLNLLGYQ